MNKTLLERDPTRTQTPNHNLCFDPRGHAIEGKN